MMHQGLLPSLTHNKRPYLCEPVDRYPLLCPPNDIFVRCPLVAWLTFWKFVSIAFHVLSVFFKHSLYCEHRFKAE
jgi:hypothetical protein